MRPIILAALVLLAPALADLPPALEGAPSDVVPHEGPERGPASVAATRCIQIGGGVGVGNCGSARP